MRFPDREGGFMIWRTVGYLEEVDLWQFEARVRGMVVFEHVCPVMPLTYALTCIEKIHRVSQ